MPSFEWKFWRIGYARENVVPGYPWVRLIGRVFWLKKVK